MKPKEQQITKEYEAKRAKNQQNNMNLKAVLQEITKS